MKNKLVFINIIIIIIIVNIFLTTSVQADNVNVNIMDDGFIDEFNPNDSTEIDTITDPITGTMVAIIKRVLGILQVVGALLSVLSIAFFGYNRLLSANESMGRELGFGPHGPGQSPDTKRSMMDFSRSMLIGSLLLFSSVTIVNIVVKLLM